MDALNPFHALADLQKFLELGGPVLSIILAATFVMWALIVERLSYFAFAAPKEAEHIRALWAARTDHTSWQAQKIRTLMISRFRQHAEQNIALILTLVVISPLLGLLGTVTGMISIFDVMAASGASDVRAMSAGVSNATITTMAGMVAAISGLIVARRLEARSRRVAADLASALEPGGSGESKRSGRRGEDAARVDMTPMLDVVFIMLIFFVATAVFVQEKTVNLIPPPRGDETTIQNPDPLILIQVTGKDAIYINQEPVDVALVGAKVSALRAEHTRSGVLIIPADAASHGVIVRIIDQVEAAGGAWSIQRQDAR